MPEAKIYSFPPLVSQRSRVLILGSMPGAASLAAGQYYAKRTNAFWPVMGALTGAGPTLPYAERLKKLDAAGVALWDVLHRCTRAGSLDAKIRDPVPQDFAAFFAKYPAITLVFFNGATAETLFRRHAAPHIAIERLHLTRLPSTSPAHAAMTLAAKIAAWSSAIKIPRNESQEKSNAESGALLPVN